MEKDVALLATLVVDLIELQTQQLMLLQQAGLMQPPIAEAILARLERMAEHIDGSSTAPFPPELAVHLKTTALRLRYLGDHGDA